MEQSKLIQNIPKFAPYEELEICGNKIGAKFLIKMVDYFPIIIGRGNLPRIWLYAKVNGALMTLVEDSVPQIRQVKFINENNYMKFSVQDLLTGLWTTLLSIEISNPQKPKIMYLNLRPLGVRMYGDDTQLHYGDSVFSNNRIFGANILINVVRGNKDL